MPDKKIQQDTPLVLSPKGLVRVLEYGAPKTGEVLFTVRSLMTERRITACDQQNRCTVIYNDGNLKEVRLIRADGSPDLNAETRDCGLLTDWLAEFDLFLDENASAATA